MCHVTNVFPPPLPSLLSLPGMGRESSLRENTVHQPLMHATLYECYYTPPAPPLKKYYFPLQLLYDI